MAESFPLKLVTPTGVVFDGPVTEVTAEGALGQFAVLAKHINYITSLVPGALRINLEDGGVENWVISGGLAEVKDGVMTVLAYSAETPASIDAQAAAVEEKAAGDRVATMSSYQDEYLAAAEALLLARARKEAATQATPAR
ncbi:MAG TPA: ATP synthase F1 subunit epsilon [Candidatus Binataceae bacterium]